MKRNSNAKPEEEPGRRQDEVSAQRASERLSRYRRERCGLTQEEMARRIGINQRTYAHYENGRYPPGKVLSELAARGLNIQWLLTGRGPVDFRLASGGAAPPEEEYGRPGRGGLPPARSGSGRKAELIPVFFLFGDREESEERPVVDWMDRERAYVRYGLEPERLRLAVAGSDAMKEVIRPGDRLRVAKWRESDGLVDGQIYVLKGRVGRSIHRVQTAGEKVHVLSENRAYENDTLRLEDFRERYEILAWVVDVIRSVWVPPRR